MSLTALEMKRLEDDARAMTSNNCRGYLSDALECLRDTRDPIAPLELLRGMWGAGHASRRDQKAALEDAGQWLEKRLGREPAISPDRLELELGWLRRLVVIHYGSGNAGGADGDWRNRALPREPAFGGHIDQLRRKRASALQRSDASDLRGDEGHNTASGTPRPERLPDVFEVRLVVWADAIAAFKTARKRREANKLAKDRLLPVEPVAAELRPLAANIACSMLDTEGMDELQARLRADAGKPPSFWIAAADLVDRDGKRVPRRLSFDPERPNGDTGTPGGVSEPRPDKTSNWRS